MNILDFRFSLENLNNIETSFLYDFNKFFKELPIELQVKILRLSNRSNSYLISKEIYQSSIYHILDDEGNNSVSENEILNYIKIYDPLHICCFYANNANIYMKLTTYVAVIKNIVPAIALTRYSVCHGYYPHNNRGIINKINDEYITLGNLDKYQVKISVGEMYQDGIDHFLYYDLLTTYYVLKERTSCMNIDPNYAKNKVLEMFNDNIKSQNNDNLLVYLRANSKMMGIHIKGFQNIYDQTINDKILVKGSDSLQLVKSPLVSQLELEVLEEVHILQNLIIKFLNNL